MTILELEKQIEIIREMLNEKVKLNGDNLLDKGVIRLSQYLDKLIIDYVLLKDSSEKLVLAS